ncbi:MULTISPECIES: FHA domain-containing protein [unclassified Mycobacterium]|uniref:FHA domain-containing protein n=1 Tax=unclassified Mycobacterium TaxID=2642494 RepID=UPI0029C9895B|nr:MULTISPECIES: FHA domain-containing protein [unclassified Mycobacterium]
MPTCPDGHDSVAVDYCDVCGTALGAAPAQQAAPAPAEEKACPACGMPSSGRFCEACGHDSALPAPLARPTATPGEPAEPPASAAPVLWTAVVAADREFHQRVLAREGPDTVEFPKFFRDRRIPLRGNIALIGRAKPEQGVEPEIDLSVHPADRGVSSQHAVLRIGDAGITITDLGSTNGTSLNGSEELIAKHEEIPLADGDRIHVGAWTTITISRSK